MNFIISHLWVFLFVSQSPWNKWSDHCFQFWNSILELNWIQNSDSLWDTCSSQPTISHYANYFPICWKWEKLYFSLHPVGHLLLQNDQKFSRAQFIINMTCFLTCTGENHQFIFTMLLLHSFLPTSCLFFPWNLFVLSMHCDYSGFDPYCFIMVLLLQILRLSPSLPFHFTHLETQP